MRKSLALSRRDILRLSTSGLLTEPAAGWFSAIAAQAATQAAPKSCILLFMSGGQSHIDTFDPKPENKTSAFQPIATSVPGIEFAENLPKLAGMAKDLAVLRGMSTVEADHNRGRYYLHTGYRLGAGGGIIHPSLGAIVSSQLGRAEDVLPNFVSIDPKNTGRANGSGYAGPRHAPLEMTSPMRGVENLSPRDNLAGFGRREALLIGLENKFIDRMRAPSAEAHLAMYQRASSLMRSPKIKAFDLTDEPASAREAYGSTAFGDGCLLARRLVESGVRFVEVVLDGWDTHTDNTKMVKELSGQFDPAMAALIADLKQRGLLDSTLVICMSEFGRSPGQEGVDGRGHYARAWTSVLAGAGLKTGQTVGKTDKLGAEVVERPITTLDFLGTVCRALDIDYTREFKTNDGRPMRIVDKGEKIISQVF